MIDARDVVRLALGHYTIPEDIKERVGPGLVGKQIAVTGSLIRHPQGPFVFDTGFGAADDENTTYWQTVRRDVVEALAEAGAISRYAQLDPWRVLFAHDLAIWERPPR